MYRHLYVHVPFCRRRCSYCDFDIAIRRSVPAADYLAAVEGEVAWRLANRLDTGFPLETVYLGGGTPSLLPPDAVARLLDLVRRTWTLTHDVEVTLEANPEDVTAHAADAWRAAGVNRISLGVQSFDDRVLEWMRRPHTASAPGTAVARLREAGFGNVSLDLIFALPAELERDWARDLDRALALAPEHLSLYGLTVEPRTPLARWLERGLVRRAEDDRYAADYLEAHRRLTAAGYQFYEVSNAGRAGSVSGHNTAYWLGHPYLGVGPAAHSFAANRRSWNHPPWEAYRAAVAAGDTPLAGQERLDDAAVRLEAIYLALRTTRGLPVASVGEERSGRWVERGWASVRDGRLRLTPAGWLLLDALVLDLTEPGGRA